MKLEECACVNRSTEYCDMLSVIRSDGGLMHDFSKICLVHGGVFIVCLSLATVSRFDRDPVVNNLYFDDECT